MIGSGVNTFTNSIEQSKIYSLRTNRFIQRENLKLYNKAQTEFGVHNPCNIYMIGQRTKAFFSPQIHISNINTIILEVLFWENQSIRNHYIHTDFPMNEIKLIEWTGSRNSIILTNSSNNKYMLSALSLLDGSWGKKIIESDFEVLYIGQAINKHDTLETKRRLTYHNKYPIINREIVQEKDLWIYLCSFDTKNYTSTCFNTLDEEDLKNVEILKEKLNSRYINYAKEININLIEAALINYFKPKYNEKFKLNFPDSEHSSYAEALQKEINTQIVYLNTDDIGVSLCSEHIQKSVNHEIKYNFIFGENRYNPFS